MLNECSGQISLEFVNSTYPINSFKEMVFLREAIASFCHLKNCKHVTSFCQQDMPPANEMMALVLFTANETMFAGIQRQSRMFSLLNLSVREKLENPRKICGGRVQKMK